MNTSVHSLWIKPTDAPNSSFIGITTTCFGQPFCPSSGVVSRTSGLVHFMQLWWPFGTRNRVERQFHPIPGTKRSSQLHKMYQTRCTANNSWWWAERLPETCTVVIPIKLEFGASVGFIHKECTDVFIILSSSTLLLVPNGLHNINYTKADVRLRTPDDGQKGCPKHEQSLYQ